MKNATQFVEQNLGLRNLRQKLSGMDTYQIKGTADLISGIFTYGGELRVRGGRRRSIGGRGFGDAE